MKFKETSLVALAFTILSSHAIGQVKDQTKYRRSNLTMVLVEDNDLGKSKDMVINAYNANPFPDKYNQHNIQDKKFATDLLKLTVADYKNAGFYNDTLKSPLDFIKAAKRPLNPIKKLNAEGTLGVVEPSKPELVNNPFQRWSDFEISGQGIFAIVPADSIAHPDKVLDSYIGLNNKVVYMNFEF